MSTRQRTFTAAERAFIARTWPTPEALAAAERAQRAAREKIRQLAAIRVQLAEGARERETA